MLSRPPSGHAAGAVRPAANRIPSQAQSVVYASWTPRAAAPAADRVRAPAGPESPLEKALQSLGGRWEWDGDLHYGRGGLEFTGTLRGSDLTYDGTPIGSLQGRVVYRAEVLTIEEAVLRLEPDAAVHLDGRIDFRGDGAVGILFSFDTELGSVVDLYALAQGGRGVTTVEAMTSPKAFHREDIVRLLRIVQRRLATLD